MPFFLQIKENTNRLQPNYQVTLNPKFPEKRTDVWVLTSGIDWKLIDGRVSTNKLMCFQNSRFLPSLKSIPKGTYAEKKNPLLFVIVSVWYEPKPP